MKLSLYVLIANRMLKFFICKQKVENGQNVYSVLVLPQNQEPQD